MTIFLITFIVGFFYDLFKVNLLGITSVKLLIGVLVLKILLGNFYLFLGKQKIQR